MAVSLRPPWSANLGEGLPATCWTRGPSRSDQVSQRVSTKIPAEWRKVTAAHVANCLPMCGDAEGGGPCSTDTSAAGAGSELSRYAGGSEELEWCSQRVVAMFSRARLEGAAKHDTFPPDRDGWHRDATERGPQQKICHSCGTGLSPPRRRTQTQGLSVRLSIRFSRYLSIESSAIIHASPIEGVTT